MPVNATKTPKITKHDWEEAGRRGEAKAKLPTALSSAELDDARKLVRLRFRSGLELAIPVAAIDEVAHLPLARLRDVRADLLGEGLIFDEAGVAIYVPGLIRDLFSDAFARALGKRGGSSLTAAKAAAVRKNGPKGGRPRKVA